MEHDGAHDDAAPWFQEFKKERVQLKKEEMFFFAKVNQKIKADPFTLHNASVSIFRVQYQIEFGLYLKCFSYSLFGIVMYCYDRIYELNDLQLNGSCFG